MLSRLWEDRWDQRLIGDACLLFQALKLLQQLHDQSDCLKEEIQQLHHQQKVKSSTKANKTFNQNQEECDRHFRLSKVRLC